MIYFSLATTLEFGLDPRGSVSAPALMMNPRRSLEPVGILPSSPTGSPLTAHAF